MLNRESYKELWEVIGWQYDDRESSDQIVTVTEDGFIVEIPDEYALGNYTFSNYQEPDPIEKQYPLNWTVEGSDDEETWTSISVVQDNEDIRAAYQIDTSALDKGYRYYKFTVTEWAGAGEKSNQISLGLHPEGYFYIPDIETPDLTTYIVTQHTANDVSADIIQRLQADMIKLATAHASLQQQLQDLMPDIEKE